LEALHMLLRETPILPDDDIQIVGWDGFRAFSIRAALRVEHRSHDAPGQMGEEGEENSPSPYPSRSSPVGLPLGEGKEAPSPGGRGLG
jgi:hypothetical protein